MTLQQLENIPPWEWPADTGRRLLDTLRDVGTRDADRRLAAELAGNLVVMNDELASTLIELVQSPAAAAGVRARAAISLGPVLEEFDTLGTDDTADDDDLPITQATFGRIQTALRRTYMDGTAPEEVRRAALEGAVRAPQPWHRDAVAAALASGSASWMLTAVFCMRFVSGFEAAIVQALDSASDNVRYHAVIASGNWQIAEAWPHVARLLESDSTDKALLLAAIEAAGSIRPDEARAALGHLLDSDDEDIVGAVEEALAIAAAAAGDDLDEDDY